MTGGFVQDKAVGYSTTRECQKVPHNVCTLNKEKVIKQKPVTSCTKVRTSLAEPGPSRDVFPALTPIPMFTMD
jgi:hypothetical protein